MSLFKSYFFRSLFFTFLVLKSNQSFAQPACITSISFMQVTGGVVVIQAKLTSNPATGLPYSLRELHLYVGNEEFPKISVGAQAGEYTIAPGKFPYKATNLTGQNYSFTVNNLSGSIYIIAHAVVHGFEE